jgi:hypothetical protein
MQIDQEVTMLTKKEIRLARASRAYTGINTWGTSVKKL